MQNGQKQNNKNDGAFASADLGGYYMGMKNNGASLPWYFRIVKVIKSRRLRGGRAGRAGGS
mgnify:CR=1 FL=1